MGTKSCRAPRVDHPMSDHGYPAAALTRFERPIGRVTGYIVECRCGWRSQITTNWQKSLDGHIARTQENK